MQSGYIRKDIMTLSGNLSMNNPNGNIYNKKQWENLKLN